MNSWYGPLLLMASGALPGVVALAATVALWRRRRVLEDDQIRFWTRVGYLWLTLFCMAAILLTDGVDADETMVALGWIGAPALTSVLGLWVFAERQRQTLEEYPSLRRMLALSTSNRQELRYVTAELSSDLNRGLAAQGTVLRGGAALRRVGRQTEDVQFTLQRLRGYIAKAHELEARYGNQIQRLKACLEDPSFDLYPLGDVQEGQVLELQEAQRDVDLQLDRLINHAVECRAAVNRALQEVSWTET